MTVSYFWVLTAHCTVNTLLPQNNNKNIYFTWKQTGIFWWLGSSIYFPADYCLWWGGGGLEEVLCAQMGGGKTVFVVPPHHIVTNEQREKKSVERWLTCNHLPRVLFLFSFLHQNERKCVSCQLSEEVVTEKEEGEDCSTPWKCENLFLMQNPCQRHQSNSNQPEEKE